MQHTRLRRKGFLIINILVPTLALENAQGWDTQHAGRTQIKITRWVMQR